MSSPDPRVRAEEAMQRITSAARSFADRCRAQAGVHLPILIHPDGDAVASLVDVELSVGAASLALPIELITFETWVLGHIGDRDELDLDVNTHHETWFGLGAWIGEALRMRHGGFWLFGGDDPRAWRLGCSKLLLEIAPHAFAEKLLRSGQGMAKRMLAEIERIRLLHEQQAQADGGKAKDRYAPQHYTRLHTVPLAQWLLIDLGRVGSLWTARPVGDLRAVMEESGKKLPPQNAPVLAKIDEALAQLDASKPIAEQVKDRGLYEAVAQVVGMRAATAPVAVDLVEHLVFPALHMGIPDKFPPLGEDDLANLRKGTDLFATMVDVVPFAHKAEEGGFLGAFAPTDMTTPYADRHDLQLGKGDWVAINPVRIRPLLEHFDPNKLLLAFERFVQYVGAQPGVPRLGEPNRTLAETTARALLDLKAIVAGVGDGRTLVFRLLPPPA